jgi:hypothetical protein
MIVPQKHAVARLLDALPGLNARWDRRTVVRLLAAIDLDRTSPVGAEIDAMLGQRVSECRDFFTLRGVRPRRSTVLRMAGRSLAADPDQIARLDAVVPDTGAMILFALSQQIETWAITGGAASAVQPILRNPLALQPATLGVGQQGERRADQSQGQDQAAQSSDPAADGAVARIAQSRSEHRREDQGQHPYRAHPRLQRSVRAQQRASLAEAARPAGVLTCAPDFEPPLMGAER